MASAKKCDLCGRLYEAYHVKNDSKKTNGIMFLNIDDRGDYIKHHAFDCCPTCMLEFEMCFEKLKKRGE